MKCDREKRKKSSWEEKTVMQKQRGKGREMNINYISSHSSRGRDQRDQLHCQAISHWHQLLYWWEKKNRPAEPAISPSSSSLNNIIICFPALTLVIWRVFRGSVTPNSLTHLVLQNVFKKRAETKGVSKNWAQTEIFTCIWISLIRPDETSLLYSDGPRSVRYLRCWRTWAMKVCQYEKSRGALTDPTWSLIIGQDIFSSQFSVLVFLFYFLKWKVSVCVCMWWMMEWLID